MRELKGLAVIALVSGALIAVIATLPDSYVSPWDCLFSGGSVELHYMCAPNRVLPRWILFAGLLAGAGWIVWSMRRSNQSQDRQPPSP